MSSKVKQPDPSNNQGSSLFNGGVQAPNHSKQSARVQGSALRGDSRFLYGNIDDLSSHKMTPRKKHSYA